MRNGLATRVSLCAVLAGATAGCRWDNESGCILGRMMPDEGAEICPLPPNGCGPESFGFLVPECPYDRVCFTSACNAHDICYSTCGTFQAPCDSQFYEDMLAACSERYDDDAGLGACRVLAYIYWQAIVRGGSPFFLWSQFRCRCFGAKPPTTRDDHRLIVDAPFGDADDDLLPDDWELAVGGDPADPDDAEADWDGDGLNTLQEFLFGRDPSEPDAE